MDDERFHVRKLAILGTGLIGGAILWAARGSRGWKPLARGITVYDSDPATRDKIVATMPGVSAAASPAEAVRDADFVVVAVPVGAMRGVIEAALPGLKAGAVVTDVGSVKKAIDDEVAPLLKGRALWVPGHPIAGGEKSGFPEDPASAALFEGARVVLTPTAETDPAALALVEAFWKALGGDLREVTPADHDHRAARISHLPHLAIAALAKQADDRSIEVAGPGFRDSTRIAAAPPAMWAGILLANRAEVGPVLDALIADLQAARAALDAKDPAPIEAIFREANAVRSKLDTLRPGL
jgi:prephenate dehydrogenase